VRRAVEPFVGACSAARDLSLATGGIVVLSHEVDPSEDVVERRPNGMEFTAA
jgi:hypothetical protein